MSVAASNRPASAGSSASSKNVVANARAGRAPKRPPTDGGSGGGRKSRSALWDNVRAFLGTVLIFLVIRAFLVEAFRIPSGSMIPSLLVGDWLFVNKLVYGPHIPFTDVNLPGYSAPSRGEVVVFESPFQEDEARVGDDVPGAGGAARRGGTVRGGHGHELRGRKRWRRGARARGRAGHI